MKKVLAFFAVALIFASCSNVGKFKPLIEELGTKWDAATTSVTDFATNVKNTQSEWMNTVSSMTIAPEAMTKWKDDAKTKYNEIQTAAQTSTNDLGAIATELDGFIANWQTKAADLQALKDGVAAGKLEGDVQAKITDLTGVANDATTKIGEWTAKFDQVKAAAASAKQMFDEFKTAQGIK
jgi:hypothetical protein